MADKGKKCVLGLPSFPNRPPISPKSFTSTPPSPTSLPSPTGSCELGWQQMQPYSANHGEIDSSSEILSRLGSFKGTICPPSALDVVLNDIPRIPPLLSRIPIKSVTPSLGNRGGITVKTELGIEYEMKWEHNMDPNINDRRFRRILSNRISAQKSRLRKREYLSDMERKKKDLVLEIARLAPLIESEQEKKKRLEMENHFLKERMRICEEGAKLYLGLVEENRAVIRRLKEVYAAQQNMYMQVGEEKFVSAGNGNWNSTTGVNDHDREQMMMMMMMGGSSPKLMVEDQALNFNSLTIDPPNSLDDVEY